MQIVPAVSRLKLQDFEGIIDHNLREPAADEKNLAGLNVRSRILGLKM